MWMDSIKFSTDIHGSQRINATDFSSIIRLTFVVLCLNVLITIGWIATFPFLQLWTKGPTKYLQT